MRSFIAGLFLALSACSQPPRSSSQSWDQENLKRHDSGCPTSIYDAPGGNLRQCPIAYNMGDGTTAQPISTCIVNCDSTDDEAGEGFEPSAAPQQL